MKKRIVVVALAIMGLSNANAQTAPTETKKSGEVSLPSSTGELEKLGSYDNGNYKYSVEDFFSKPKARTFRLSPDGLRMSYFQKTDNGKNNVYVKEIKTGKVSLVIVEKEELIRGYSWLNNERLVYVMDKEGMRTYMCILLPSMVLLQLI